ncbi:MAG: sigma-70 family RNA polymerase sigma factor, partial [Pyrinomonadaceae bacterium]
AVSYPEEKELDILAVEEALQSLEKLDTRQAKIVELRFFGGLSIQEAAYVLGISETTVRREWTFAKAWFQRELGQNRERRL